MGECEYMEGWDGLCVVGVENLELKLNVTGGGRLARARRERPPRLLKATHALVPGRPLSRAVSAGWERARCEIVSRGCRSFLSRARSFLFDCGDGGFIGG